jgi:hypothetical protein
VTGQVGSADDAQRLATLYFKSMRWQDLRGSTQMVESEQRSVYQSHVDDEHLEDHLKVTEYELRDVSCNPNGLNAEASADLSWYVEPSVTLKHEVVTLHLTWRNSRWMIASIHGGPIELPPIPEHVAAPVASTGAPAPVPDAG